MRSGGPAGHRGGAPGGADRQGLRGRADAGRGGRLEAIGVYPAGLPLRGIRYLDAGHRADALFRAGHGLGVRRTALHAALTQRAAQLAIPVVPVRVNGLAQHADRVSAAGIEARYLVAADGLHSSIRRACALEPPPARHAGSGCAVTTAWRRGATWSRCTGRREPRLT